MKIIKYKVLQGEAPCEVAIGYSETNLEIAKREAFNGEYTVEDDGQSDPVAAPTQLDMIEAQVAYTAMMTDTLLEV